MTLKIRGKLGTHPTAIYEVRDSDEPPSVGDTVEVRSKSDLRVAKWTRVIVELIKFGDFYYITFR